MYLNFPSKALPVANSPSTENTPSRYVVGFDLGTTNSAVTYVDTTEEPWQVRVFAVPQLVAAGQVEARETLPSFHYQPGPGELPPAALRLPWTAAGAPRPGSRRTAARRRLFRPRSWRRGAGAVDQFGQVVALPLGRRPHGRASPLARSGRRPATVAGRGQRAVSGPRPRRLGRPLPAASAGPAGFRAHAAGLVRRSGAGTDDQGGRLGRPAASRADRRTAGGVLCLDRRPSRPLGPACPSRVRRSSSATSAAARPTSR